MERAPSGRPTDGSIGWAPRPTTDYPTPRSTVRRLDRLRFELLRDGVEALRASSIAREHRAKGVRDLDDHRLAMAGPDGRFTVRTDQAVPDELQRVLDLSAEIAADHLP